VSPWSLPSPSKRWANARFMAGAGGEAATIVQRSIALHEDLGRPDLANRPGSCSARP
jgi:hypothetical protein